MKVVVLDDIQRWNKKKMGMQILKTVVENTE